MIPADDLDIMRRLAKKGGVSSPCRGRVGAWVTRLERDGLIVLTWISQKYYVIQLTEKGKTVVA